MKVSPHDVEIPHTLLPKVNEALLISGESLRSGHDSSDLLRKINSGRDWDGLAKRTLRLVFFPPSPHTHRWYLHVIFAFVQVCMLKSLPAVPVFRVTSFPIV